VVVLLALVTLAPPVPVVAAIAPLELDPTEPSVVPWPPLTAPGPFTFPSPQATTRLLQSNIAGILILHVVDRIGLALLTRGRSGTPRHW
jgi:hypothetical protein